MHYSELSFVQGRRETLGRIGNLVGEWANAQGLHFVLVGGARQRVTQFGGLREGGLG